MPTDCGIPFSNKMVIVHKHSALAHYNYFQIRMNQDYLMVILQRWDMFLMDTDFRITPFADFANAPKRPDRPFYNIESHEEEFALQHFSEANSILRVLRKPNCQPQPLLVTTKEVPDGVEVLHDYSFCDDPRRLTHPRYDGTSIGYDSWSLHDQLMYFENRVRHQVDSFSIADMMMTFIDFIKYDMMKTENFTSPVVHEYLRYRRGQILYFFTPSGEEDNLGPLWDLLLVDPVYGTWYRALHTLGMELAEYVVSHLHIFPTRRLVDTDLRSVAEVFNIAFSVEFWLLYTTCTNHDFDTYGMHHASAFFGGRITKERMLELPYSPL